MFESHTTRLFSSAVVAVFASAVTITDSLAQSWTYRTAPPPLIRTITPLANNPAAGTNTLIVSTLTDGMYKGTETVSATTWQKINAGIPIVQVRTHATITPSPATNPVTDIYAATEGAGVYKTTNGGTSWTAINGSGAGALGCLDVRSITVPVTIAPRTLLVSTSCRNNSGVYQSTDDGVNWARVGPLPPAANALPLDVQSSALTRSGSFWFLATSNYGLFLSNNAGATWTSPTASSCMPANSNVFAVSFSGVSGTSELLAYVHGIGICRSTDTGVTWALSNGTGQNSLPAGFAALGGISRESGQTLYIGTDQQGVYKTVDGGVNWTAWGTTANDENAQFTRTIVADSTGSGKYYLGTLAGIIKTSDNAVTLSGTNMPGGGRINAITHDRDASYVAFVTAHIPVRINYIYGDYNSDALITLLGNGVTGATNDGVVYQDRFSAASPLPLYISTNNRGLFKSTNGGTSFTAVNSGLPSMIGQANRLAFDNTPNVPENSRVLYLGLRNAGGVYKSTNGGASWVSSSAGLSTPLAMSVNFVTVDGNNAAIVWAATDAGVFKSIDSGASWVLKYSAVDGAGSALPTGIVRVRPENSNEVYIANNHVNANGTLTGSSGILKSVDGGINWANILSGVKGSQVRVTTSGDIYAGVSAQIGNPAVYLSTNGGTSFTSISTNLQGSDIRSFGMAADQSALISLSLENGFYTNDAIPIAPTVPLLQAITDAPGVFLQLVFQPQAFGTTSAPRSVTITNSTASAAIIVGFATDNSAFTVQSHTCGTTLAAGASCTVNVVFAPNPPIAGETIGNLVAYGPISGIAVGLWGAGYSPVLPFARVSLSPGAVPAYPEWTVMGTNFRELSFGTRAIGTARTLSYTLSNFGGAVLNISSITVDSARFVKGTGVGTCGATLAPGTTCLLTFTYTPIAVGVDLGNVNITTDSAFTNVGQLNFSLTGAGETPGLEGSLVSTFGDAGRAYISTGPYGTEVVTALAHQADGKTLALMLGRKAVEDGNSIGAVVRLNTDGTLDNTFGSSGVARMPAPGSYGFDTGSSVFVAAGGKILVTLNITNVTNTANDTYVYRLLANGQIDTSFGTAGVTVIAKLVHNVRLTSDGKIVLGGLDSTQAANNALIFTRLTADGVVDTTFGTNGTTQVFLLDAVQGGISHLELALDGKLLFAYSFGAGAARDIAIYRLSANGIQDTTWGTAGRVNVAPTNREDNLRITRQQPDGKILLLSRTARAAFPAKQEFLLARLNSDGALDPTFGSGGVVETLVEPSSPNSNDFASAMRVLSDGKIIVSGRRNNGLASATQQDIVVMRYLPNGSLDPAFGVGGIKVVVLSRFNDSAHALDIDADGTIVVGGDVPYNDIDRGSAVGTGHVIKLKNTVSSAGSRGVVPILYFLLD